ncbi:tRNA guanosine(34) transglycosylase Tgt [Candidatus Parcubacteria bacterium]|nr:MAG: tRNA guanosine(34) transglycosylase Tgt [Candidatus Parcubacteria bacterium]
MTGIVFSVQKRSRKSRARLGVLETPHGTVITPSLVPVATRGVVKTLTSSEAAAAGAQILIANAFHLHLRPGEDVVRRAGGLHQFMGWDRPLMTDSGGFQVFSLGWGFDTEGGKFFKSSQKGNHTAIEPGAQPRFVRIEENGVFFRSPIDGKELFLGPRESIGIQEQLGADIMFAFDECTSPRASYAYAKRAMEQNHRWAVQSLDARKGKSALFGIVHGSRFRRLRTASARFLNGLEFDGFGIGGDLGDLRGGKRTMLQILDWTIPLLDERKPRHLLGVGYLEDIEEIVKRGIDTFDCTVPTLYARRGIAFTSSGKLDLRRSKYLRATKPLDSSCKCLTCTTTTRMYLAHLFRAGEITGMRLLTIHNLTFFHAVVARVRRKIARGLL